MRLDGEPIDPIVPIVPPYLCEDERDVLDPDFDDFDLAEWSVQVLAVND